MMKEPHPAIDDPSFLKSDQTCDLCGTSSFQVFSKRGRNGSPITTVICETCGLVYTNPRPDQKRNAEFYHHSYWKDYKNKPEPDEKFFNHRIRKTKAIMKELRAYTKPGMTVLECGCSVGALLSCIQSLVGENGKAVGIEPDQNHAKFARERKGLDVRTGLVEEVKPGLAPQSFDLIVMNHVLEHTISPTQVFLDLKDLLKINGYLIVEIPNVEAPGSRLSHFFHTAHHFAFSPNTLLRLAQKTDFFVRRIEALDGDLPGTRLIGVFQKTMDPPHGTPLDSVRDDPSMRASALKHYERWYWLTAASIRKKITHWKRLR